MEGMMKQAILTAKDGPWEIKEVPIPKPGPGQALIKLKAASICNQTDLNTIRGKHPSHDRQLMELKPHDLRRMYGPDYPELSRFYPPNKCPLPPYPTLMGHEGAGEIIELGPSTGFLGGEKFEVGDKVAMIFLTGGFGEYAVCDLSTMTKMNEGMSFEEASLFEPCSIIYNMSTFVLKPVDVVCILGQGALGLLTTQYCRRYGADTIITTEPNPMKRELSKKFGADYVLDPNEVNIVEELERITNGRGVDCIFEAAGVPDTIQCVPYIGKQGMIGARVGQIGACCDPVLVDWGYIHLAGLTIYDNRSMNNPPTSEQLQRIMRSMKVIDLKSMITHKYKLEDIDQAFKDVEAGGVVKGVFVYD